jgi:hypothetical protein
MSVEEKNSVGNYQHKKKARIICNHSSVAKIDKAPPKVKIPMNYGKLNAILTRVKLAVPPAKLNHKI